MCKTCLLVQTIFNTEVFLSNLKNFISLAKGNNVPVIFSKITPLQGKFESPDRRYFFRKRRSSMNQTPEGLELTIRPTDDDIVIPKNTASIFIGTGNNNFMNLKGQH